MRKPKLQLKIQKFVEIILKTLCSFFCFFIFFRVANAAVLKIDSQNTDISLKQQFQTDLLLNTQGEEINAVEGEILFPKDLLELKKINEGNSIINLWIEKPAIKDGKIIFSGITPGGYHGDGGLLLSLIFQTKKEGSGLIKINNAKALLNDGKGTEAKLQTINYRLKITKIDDAIAGRFIDDSDLDDGEPPEIFTAIISQDPKIFNGKYFIVFAAQDKNSGIDHYEIKEGSGDYLVAKSPYLLRDQSRQSGIIIKAIDKSGNERIAQIEARHEPSSRMYQNYLIFGIILMIIVIYLFYKK